jgi:hypothetical protein
LGACLVSAFHNIPRSRSHSSHTKKHIAAVPSIRLRRPLAENSLNPQPPFMSPPPAGCECWRTGRHTAGGPALKSRRHHFVDTHRVHRTSHVTENSPVSPPTDTPPCTHMTTEPAKTKIGCGDENIPSTIHIEMRSRADESLNPKQCNEMNSPYFNNSK